MVAPSESNQAELSYDELRRRLEYNPDTGHFLFRAYSRHGPVVARAGKRAGSGPKGGYRRIGMWINGRGVWYSEHRLAWLYMTGEWPPQYIDHINRVCDDNRWCNLRLATARENQHNRKDNHDHPGVRRFDYGCGLGYSATWSEDGKRTSKFFSDSKFGGQVQAHDAAKRWHMGMASAGV